MAITVEMRTEISQLYVALFGRAPDGEGLGFWVQLRDGGMSLTEIANTMYDTAPARDYYPLFLTNEEIIASFYVNVLGRTADAEGLAFWTAKLNATGATPGSVITEMIDVVANYAGIDPAGLTSQALFNNKVEVAQYYGEANGNIEDAATVLATVTSDDATVTAAIAAIDAGTIGQDGIDVTLTVDQDSIAGSPANDIVHGTFGTGAGVDTYTAGDSIDLGQGTVDQLDLVATGAAASAAIVVKNTEFINIQDTVGATFDALLVENTPAINFTNTLAGQTSTTKNTALASVIGLSGKGNLTVDYLSTSGKADTAMISLNGVGTSTTARSTINVSDTNTIEAVNLATAGTNFVTMTGGTGAASLVITGSGTNNFALSAADSLAAVATIDASASTGTNTFAMGGNLNTGTTIKGGTGADTVSGTLASASLVGPTLTGVETLATTFTAAAVVDLATATGLTTVSVSASTANMKFQNAQSTVSSLAVTSLDTANSTLTFGYGAATKGDLALKIGSTTGAIDLGAVSLSNTNSVAVSTVGGLVHDFDSLKITGTQTSVSFTTAASSTLTTGTVTATGSINALSFTTGAESTFSGYIDVAAGKDVGDVTLTLAGGSELGATVYANDGSIGNATLTATGNDISGYMALTVSGGSVGDVTVSLTGDDGDIGWHVSAGNFSGGDASDIGNITVTVTGDDSNVSGAFSASGGSVGDIMITVTGDNNGVHVSGDVVFDYPDSTYAFGGNVGNITVAFDGDSSGGLDLDTSGGHAGNIALSANNGAAVAFNLQTNSYNWYSGAPAEGATVGNIGIFVGADSSVSGSVSADGGNVGNIAIVVNGDNASGLFSVAAIYRSGGAEEGLDSNDYQMGGNVGDISIDVAGSNAHYGQWSLASGGDVGSVTVSSTDGGSGWNWVGAQMVGSGSTGGDVGAVSITIGDDSSWWFGFDVDGAIESLTVTGGDNADFELSGGGGWNWFNTDSASLGAAALTFGDDATVWYHVSGFSGSVGTTALTFGEAADVDFLFNNITGSVGAITGTFGADAAIDINYSGAIGGSVGAVNLTTGATSTVYVSVSGAVGSVGKVTLTGGDSSSSAGVWVSDTGNMIATHGGVDASAWLGSLGVDLEAVTLGTTIRVGADGSWVRGTEGADNIFLGAGDDTVAFDATPTSTDVVFTFTAGAGNDMLDLPAAGTTLKAVMSADAAATAVNGDIYRLVDIAGNQDITTVGDGTATATGGLLGALNAGGEYASLDETASNNFTILTAASSSATTVYVFNVTDDGDAVFEAGEITLVGVVNGATLGTYVIDNFVA